MSKSTCCSICLSTDRRTINIYGTNLQYIYETLAYYKITDVESWMCYICHTRLRQCHQLRQLAMRTRGRTEFVLQNKVDHRVYRSVVKLSTSRIMTISTVPTLHIKQESDVKTEACSDNELEAERIDNEVEKNTSIKSKCASTKKVSEITSKVSQSKIDEYDKYPTTSSGHAKINHERAENMKNKGEEQNKQINTDQTQDASKAEAMKPHKCDVCSKRFRIKSLLVIHYRTHTGEKPFKCDVCFKNFSSKSNLIVHKQIHTGYRYTCDICSKQFSYRYSLKVHKQIHNVHKPYKCAVCPKSFTQKHNFNYHMHVHAGLKPYSCEICFKKYARKGELHRHLCTHLETKAFSCKVCSRKFTERRYLVSHSLVHTGLKNYTCDVCPMKFSTKSGLNKHKHTHTGYKPHKCDFCSKSFLSKSHLSRHGLIHTGEKPFSCDTCLKKFTRKNYLKEHLQSVCTRDQHLL